MPSYVTNLNLTASVVDKNAEINVKGSKTIWVLPYQKSHARFPELLLVINGI